MKLNRLKSEALNPKFETNSKLEIQMLETVLDFGYSIFVLVSGFDIRISNL